MNSKDRSHLKNRFQPMVVSKIHSKAYFFSEN
jgi:hypothetical protein